MVKTQRILMVLLWLVLILTAIIVVLYETDALMPGANATNKESEFLCVTVMELASLAGVFFALRLFKFKKIHQSLISEKAPALLKFGVLRLLVLEMPMLVNTLLYYMYMNTTFGYLAIMQLLCLPFVYPTMNRCIAETTEDEAV